MGDSPSPERNFFSLNSATVNPPSPEVDDQRDQWLTLTLSTVPQRQPKPHELLTQQQQCTPSIPSSNFQQMPPVTLTPLYSYYATSSYLPLPHQAMPLIPHPHDQDQDQPPPSADQPPSSEVQPICEETAPQEEENEDNQDQELSGPSRPGRGRRQGRGLRDGKGETITPPYPWATSSRATVHRLQHLLSQNMVSITGTVQCKRCEEKYDIAFDLKQKFCEIAVFIAQNRYMMHDRAPSAWTNPVLPTCNRCGQENSLRPVITKKRAINWLFLLLGQMIGCCTLSHLKYFCKHTRNHRTAAKDRLIYLTYLGLCKQLSPDGPFDV